MAKKRQPRRSQEKPKIEELDLDPNAWLKFEKLIRDAAKGRPKSVKKPS